MGKTRVIAETGAGQHGMATATMAAKMGFECTIYMGEVDVERQRPNVFWMQRMGAEVVPVRDGTHLLKDAINEAFRDWVTNVDTTHYVLGTACGPHPFPALVTYFLQNADGQMNEAHSVAAGLDYVGVSPTLAAHKESGRVRFEAATDAEVIDALALSMRKEGLIPALESSHAFAQAFKEAGSLSPDDVILINQSGRADKDIFTVADVFGDEPWREFIRHKAEEYGA
jgi:tryptophan synthase beta subunit